MNPTTPEYLLETLKSFRGLKSTAEKALAQIDDIELHYMPDMESNSVAILIQHMAGNMLSRFTGFLTTDGEKPDRNRDGEFVDQKYDRARLMELWDNGWQCLLSTMETLDQSDLNKIVFIRGEEHTVLRALQRQLVHYAYHTGQIVFLCKMIKKAGFKTLSIPKKRVTDSGQNSIHAQS